MEKRQFKIFIDFDGTITLNDVGEEIFNKFLNADIVNVIVDDLLNDRITSRVCWENLCSAVQSINKNELDEFILSRSTERRGNRLRLRLKKTGTLSCVP